MVAFRKLFPVLAIGALTIISAYAHGIANTNTAPQLADNGTFNNVNLVCQANVGVPPAIHTTAMINLTANIAPDVNNGSGNTINTAINLNAIPNISTALTNTGPAPNEYNIATINGTNIPVARSAPIALNQTTANNIVAVPGINARAPHPVARNGVINTANTAHGNNIVPLAAPSATS